MESKAIAKQAIEREVSVDQSELSKDIKIEPVFNKLEAPDEHFIRWEVPEEEEIKEEPKKTRLEEIL